MGRTKGSGAQRLRFTLRGFTLLELALAIAVLVSLSSVAYLSFSNSNQAIGTAGDNYTEGYLGEIEGMLDDAGLNDESGASSSSSVS